MYDGKIVKFGPFRFLRQSAILLFIIAFTVLTGLFAGVAFCLENPEEKDYNVILISIDALRADHLSTYGYKPAAPDIESFSRRCTVFSQAYSQTSWTLPSHISMLTSEYPSFHKVIFNDRRLPPQKRTLTEILRDHGYNTAAFVSAPYAKALFGFDQGFNTYDDSIAGDMKLGSHRQITSTQLNDKINSWLDAAGPEKFFLFLHYWDVHSDYIPPYPYNIMFYPEYQGNLDVNRYWFNSSINSNISENDLAYLISQYDGEIAWVDAHIGDLIRKLYDMNLMNRTNIILTSDHGEEFFEHGGKTHRKTIYEEVLHVPLIMYIPDRKPEIINTPATHVDLPPTVLSLLGKSYPKEFQGLDLFSPEDDLKRLPEWAVLNQDRLIYHELHKKERLLTVGARFYMQNEPHMLFYHMKKKRDAELMNVLRDKDVTERFMRDHPRIYEKVLDKIKSYLKQSGKTAGMTGTLDEDTRKQLETLGYIEGY